MPTTIRPTPQKSAAKGSAARPHSDGHRTRPVSKAAVAAARGCARSTVSRAVRPGGPLHPALIPGSDRIDAAHPACRAWIGALEGRTTVYGMTTRQAINDGMVDLPAPVSVQFLDPSRVVTLERLAELAGVPLAEVVAMRDQFEDATPLDFDHPALQAFLAEQGVVL